MAAGATLYSIVDTVVLAIEDIVEVFWEVDDELAASHRQAGVVAAIKSAENHNSRLDGPAIIGVAGCDTIDEDEAFVDVLCWIMISV